MRIALCSLIILASSLASASAQSFSSDDMAELVMAIDEKTAGRWLISFTTTDRTLNIESRESIEGEYREGGVPPSSHGKYRVTLRLRITAKPSDQNRKRYTDLQRHQTELDKKISDNVRIHLGFQKGNPERLTKAEWRQYFQFRDLERQLDELEPPTFAFRSTYFFYVAPLHIDFDRNSSSTARQLLSDREAILGLFIALDP